MNPLYLGIDLGTSAVKAMAIDTQDRVVAQSSAALSIQRPQALWSEQDPEQWWQATLAAVQALPDEARRAVRGIGLSGQMHGAVILDAADRVLRPAILWNDGRSSEQCMELQEREPRLQKITGNLAMPGFTAPKLLWMRQHEPELFARTASVLLPKDYLRLRLTGDKLTDMSDASGTLWLDVARRAWSDDLLAATGLQRRQMPALIEGNAAGGSLRSTVAAELRLDNVIVAGGGGDNAASAIGCGVIAPGQALLSLGTSGVLFVVTERFRPNPERAAHAFCHALPARWHQMSVMLSASSAIDWAARVAGFYNPANAARAARERGLRRETPIFLPYLSGERTPYNDVNARGVFFGLGNNTEPADLVVAAIEGVAQAFADGMEVLLQAGSEIADLSAVGGGSRNVPLLELLATVLERPLNLRSGGELGAAFGAARLGRMAVTGEDPGSACAVPPLMDTVAPSPRLHDLLSRRRPIFKSLYRQLQQPFKEFSA
jgi:xylulokinase